MAGVKVTELNCVWVAQYCLAKQRERPHANSSHRGERPDVALDCVRWFAFTDSRDGSHDRVGSLGVDTDLMPLP
jgi:hypothetical protein